LGHFFRGEGETDFVIARICELSQAIEETQGLEHSGVDADADCMVTCFDPLQRRAAGEGSFGDHLGRKASPAASVTDIEPELAKGSTNGH